jgi:hypothetical protein
MIDAEVVRLRKLRNAALRARALANGLDSGCGELLFSKSAVTCWGIARFVTGYLRAHPNVSCQKGPSQLRDRLDQLSASALVLVVRRRRRRVSLLADQLRHAARELDDVRALTRSPELSDALARLQGNMRRLIGQRVTGHGQPDAAVAVQSAALGRIGLADNWPYMTI